MSYLISFSYEHKRWQLRTLSGNSKEMVVIGYSTSATSPRGHNNPITRRKMVEELGEIVIEYFDLAIIPGHSEWIIDLDKLRTHFPELASKDWLRGKIALEPEFETYCSSAEQDAAAIRTGQGQWLRPYEDWAGELSFTVMPEMVNKSLMVTEAPVEVRESLHRFHLDFPDPRKVAFVIMRFGATKAHMDIDAGIKEALGVFGITGIRADEKQYHDDLFHNVLTYMHGCGFGIAVFDRIEEESFNPNISLEVGYMLALKKPLCILKDRTLKTLHSDLVGRLYRVFDPLDPKATIYAQIAPWLRDKGFA